MSKRAAPPSAARTPSRRPVDVRGWLGGIRLSGFMAIMLGLVVLAAFVLVPTVATFVEQRQRIAALAAAVQVTEAEVAELERERERWSDPAYITTQARERLYYVQPGEVVYLVDNDLDAADLPATQTDVPEDVARTQTDWMAQLVRSVAGAGLAETAAPELIIGVPDESETTPTPTPGER